MRQLVISRIRETRFFTLRFLESLSDERLLELYEERKK